MRFGKIENNLLLKIFRFVFVILISANCTTFIACQSREQKVGSILKQCQQLLDRDELESAIKCYAEAAVKYPENDGEIIKAGNDAFFGKCVEYKNKEDVKNALRCFYAAVGLVPEKANVYFQLADSYFQYAKQEQETNKFYDQDLLVRAEAAVKKGLEIAPEDAPAHALYGEILERKGDWQAAVREYKTTVKLKPETDFYWLFLAVAQEKAEKTQEAIESYKRVLTLNPNKTLALYYLGKLYEKTGNTDKAIENFEKLLKIDSEYDDARERLDELKKQKSFKIPKGAIIGVPNSPQ